MASLARLAESELCPSCGNFVDYLYPQTGFCKVCSNSVGVFIDETPTPSVKAQRLELWLAENADTIEDVMLDEGLTAKEAIKKVAKDGKPHCQCCGDEMPHTTAGRHIFCTKKPKCRKARRYYRYLLYEKGITKDEALEKTLVRFGQ